MQRVKRRTFSGVVCEQEVYNVPDRIKSLEKAEPRPRFKNEEERELHRIGISRRKHARLINENYGPIITPDPDSYGAYTSAVIYADSVTTEGQITFHCEETPTEALKVSIMKIKVEG